MRISAPKIQAPSLTQGGWRVSADLTWEGQKPRPLWFELTPYGVPGAQLSETPPLALLEPFLLTLLLPAMQKREDIFVSGALCPRFLQGMERVQETFHRWYPTRFFPVQIHAEGDRIARPATQAPPRRTAAAFSSGVDSFYTLLTQRPQAVLFVAAGFDMPARHAQSVADMTAAVRSLMQERGVELWVASTNAREHVDTADWTNVHGAVLAACALFLEDQWGTFLVPSSYLQLEHPKWGTHPELDPYFSTREIQFVHPPETADRVSKLRVLAREPQTYARLRVCWIQDIGVHNCTRCEKCLRTLAGLRILGVAERYTTFEAISRTQFLRRLLLLPQRAHQSRLFSRELIQQALRSGRFAIAGVLGASLLLRWVRRAGRSLASRLLP